MPKPTVNYTVYLVTDSTPALLGDRDLVSVVEEALRGGVTIVQYRDKHCDRAAAVETAKKLHAACRRHNVPLLVNDRVDVAVEVGCEGVHIGQDDMGELGRPSTPCSTYIHTLASRTTRADIFQSNYEAYAEARRMLGPDKIIGVTASSLQEAVSACEAGADYLGVGTVYATATHVFPLSLSIYAC